MTWTHTLSYALDRRIELAAVGEDTSPGRNPLDPVMRIRYPVLTRFKRGCLYR
jgi:hypothetical protein